mmetsp:Transcript_20954/g.37444  ORF Transcript_20954/g.37444 Transcript_20954/m.37444 type:complete len:82 (-) Transcript_20954:796-1041(-)
MSLVDHSFVSTNTQQIATLIRDDLPATTRHMEKQEWWKHTAACRAWKRMGGPTLYCWQSLVLTTMGGGAHALQAPACLGLP